jgi:ankyrin repeat protein
MSFITEKKGEMSVDVVSLHPFLSSHSRISRRTLSLKKWEGRDDRGWTPLHIAAKKGDLEEVSLFISLYNQYCFKKKIL